MRRLLSRRGLVITMAVSVGLALTMVLVVLIGYPRLGAWAIRSKVVPRLESRLNRDITIGAVDVQRGTAVLKDVTVAGPTDTPHAPLAHIERVFVTFDFWASLIGNVRIYRMEVDGLQVRAARAVDGTDNFRDVIEALGLRTADPNSANQRSSSLGRLRPDLLTVNDASLTLDDQAAGITMASSHTHVTVNRDSPVQASLSQVEVRTAFGPRASAKSVTVTAELTDPIGTAMVRVVGGEVAAHRAISLSNIEGTIESGSKLGRLLIDLSGSYGGATEQLWDARGWLDPLVGDGSIHVKADRFTFDRLDSILADSVVIDYRDTAIDGEVDIAARAGRITFTGSFELWNVNVFHPMLAEKPVTDVDITGNVSGHFDTESRTLTVNQAELRSRNVDYQMTGVVRMPGGVVADTGERRSQPHVSARLVIPTLSCQTMLRGIPEALTPYINTYELRGRFHTDLRVDINWADLDATQLDGSVGIFGCKVIKEPGGDAGIERFLESFTHYVEVEQDQWLEFIIGPENLDFVPLWDVSEHLTNSLMTTEDSRFYRHKGFIVSEFRTALIKNLKAKYFRYGASSITMQTVKNVLLYREKTLSRKLQELFLTWHIENVLEKDRIFEIYVNAIEYGPGLYGIGPAARHYFGKHPRDLNPVEAAFFSSILPSPKLRYRQYCEDQLFRKTVNKIDRILNLMLKRERLNEDDYFVAKQTQLVFDRTEAPSERECKKLIKRAIENSRPTNPMKK